MKFKGEKTHIDSWVTKDVEQSGRGKEAHVDGHVQICCELYTDISLIFTHSCTHLWRKAICYQSNHGQSASLSSIRVALHSC